MQCDSSFSKSASSRWPAVARAHAMLETPCRQANMQKRHSFCQNGFMSIDATNDGSAYGYATFDQVQRKSCGRRVHLMPVLRRSPGALANTPTKVPTSP